MTVRRTYVDAGWGQVHCLTAGESGPWIGLFHESPLSAEVWGGVLGALAGSARVVAFDTPGYGSSTPPPGAGQEIEDYAAALAQAATEIGMHDAVFAGVHTGASLAIEVAHRFVGGVTGVVLSGVALLDDEERSRYLSGWTPPAPVDVDGSQFTWAVERYRRIWPDLTPGLLQTAVVELMRVADRYDWAYRAAFRHDPAGPLAALELPVLLLDAEHDLLADKDELALELARDGRLHVLPGLPGQPHLRAPHDYARALGDFALSCASGAPIGGTA